MNDGVATDRPAKLAVMLSGSGRTLLNLLDAMSTMGAGRLDASVPLVIASRECLGAERAREHGLRTIVETGEIPADRLEALLDAHGVGWVALAGYLLLVNIPPRFDGRVVNIHPALLPGFGGAGMYGLRVHRAVLDAGATESGCTVHLCDNRYDAGPIILRKTCPVEPDDTPETLAARVFELECTAYPEALQLLFERGVSING